jgi:hypothetical protein
MNAQFDPIKNVYRVYNADNSYQTYTPAQYRKLLDSEPVVEEEEADIVLEIKETNVLDNVTVDTDDITDITDEVVEEVTTGDTPIVATGLTSNNN